MQTCTTDHESLKHSELLTDSLRVELRKHLWTKDPQRDNVMLIESYLMPTAQLCRCGQCDPPSN